MKKIKTPIIICLIIIALIVVIIKTGKIGFVGTTFYTVSKGECNSDIIHTYSDGYSNVSLLNDKGECKSPGYYIYGKEININIGNMNCGNTIKIEKIKIKKGMNVYIKAKEKKVPAAMQAQCLCSPSLNITFSKKVNSVTLENEEGTILNKCA